MATPENANGTEILNAAQRDGFLCYLDTLLASTAFAASRRRGDLLRYLVERTHSGHADAITEYGIGLDVYRKSDENFDEKPYSLAKRVGHSENARGSHSYCEIPSHHEMLSKADLIVSSLNAKSE
jgi:hypothetical protein